MRSEAKFTSAVSSPSTTNSVLTIDGRSEEARQFDETTGRRPARPHGPGMSLIDTIVGRPLASNEADDQDIGPAAGVPTFGLDALSSAAYGPEAALTVLLPLGAAGLTLILPITVAIVILLGIVYASYRQTIAAYPNGGGSYTVARENLRTNPSLLAAAALMTDSVLKLAG